MNDNEVMSIAEKILLEHKMCSLFSYRYAFLLGWRGFEQNMIDKFNTLKLRAYLIADELKELNCLTYQLPNSEEE